MMRPVFIFVVFACTTPQFCSSFIKLFPFKMNMGSRQTNAIKSTNTIIQKTDPEMFEILESELNRQNVGINLIASENYASASVLQALGSVMTNKYSEGQVS